MLFVQIATAMPSSPVASRTLSAGAGAIFRWQCVRRSGSSVSRDGLLCGPTRATSPGAVAATGDQDPSSDLAGSGTTSTSPFRSSARNQPPGATPLFFTSADLAGATAPAAWREIDLGSRVIVASGAIGRATPVPLGEQLRCHRVALTGSRASALNSPWEPCTSPGSHRTLGAKSPSHQARQRQARC